MISFLDNRLPKDF